MSMVLAVVLIALVFTYINGFHDTANSIATVVATKVLTPGQAVILAAITNLIGALWGTAVAKTIAAGLIDTSVVAAGSQLLICALAAPVDRPIQFKITASTVMNSFFIPSLAGQIYAMPGMETKLHAVINKAGTYEGISANYSGAGFSGMHFKFLGLSEGEFEQWVAKAKDGGALTRESYLQLEKPSENEPVRRYASVVPDLYPAIVNLCVAPGTPCMHETMAKDAARAGKPAGEHDMSHMEHMEH